MIAKAVRDFFFVWTARSLAAFAMIAAAITHSSWSTFLIGLSIGLFASEFMPRSK